MHEDARGPAGRGAATLGRRARARDRIGFESLEGRALPSTLVRLTDFEFGGGRSADVTEMVEVGGTIYMAVSEISGAGSNAATVAQELWATDGTPGGARKLARFNQQGLLNLTAAAGRLFFQVSTPSAGISVYVSDGTPGGTHVLTAAASPGGVSANGDFIPMDGFVLFSGWTPGVQTAGLYRSDGTPEGTFRVAGSSDRTTGLYIINISQRTQEGDYAILGGSAYFMGGNATAGYELWKSDGTAAGTMQVADIHPQGPTPLDENSSSPRLLTTVGDRVYFYADDGTHGVELWRSDGTAAGTAMVADLAPGTASSLYLRPTPTMAAVGDTLYFAPFVDPWGVELWRSDGTAAGTHLVKDLNTSPSGVSGGFHGSYPGSFKAVGGMLYFVAGGDGDAGYELWRSDGTAAGTYLVKDIAPGWAGSPGFGFPLSSGVASIAEFGGVLYFSASDRFGRDPSKPVGPGLPPYVVPVDEELWRSDGTEAGTRAATDLFPGHGDVSLGVDQGSHPKLLAARGDGILMIADDGVHGRELWLYVPDASDVRKPDLYIDGGADGLWAWTSGAGLRRLNPADPQALAAAPDGTLYVDYGPYGLWRWDGIALAQVNGADPQAMDVAPDGSLYIDYGAYGLWRYTAAGLVAINGADPEAMAPAADGSLYIDYGAYGLWRWAGGATYQVNGADPEGLAPAVDGSLYIDYGRFGLWRWVGGTTVLVNAADPGGLAAAADGSLYIDYGTYGLWSYSAAGLVQLNAGDPQGFDVGRDGFLYVDFGPFGIWRRNPAGAFAQIAPIDPQALAG